MKFTTTLLLLLFISCAPKDSNQTSDADDCYNKVSTKCNKDHPKKDWGDKVYRDCITDGLDECDKAGTRLDPGNFPTLDASGRFTSK